MPTQDDCESWLGEIDQDYCEGSGSNQVRRYVRQTESHGTKTAYRYGWRCECCEGFELAYEFVIVSF
jgi:hypothetical protein